MSFRHKGLRLLHQDGNPAKLPPELAPKITLILTRLEAAREPQDLDRPGAGLHSLSGDLAGFWSVKVNKNFRIIFRFEREHAADVDYLDYH